MEHISIHFCQQLLEFGSLSCAIKKPDLPNRARALPHPWMHSEQVACGSAGVELRGDTLGEVNCCCQHLEFPGPGSRRLLRMPLTEPRGCSPTSHPSLPPGCRRESSTGERAELPERNAWCTRGEQQKGWLRRVLTSLDL